MTTVGRFIPIYDAWSNEGGGRGIEEMTRYSERMDIAAMIKEYQPEIDRLNRADANNRARLAAMQDAFVQRYGADALANKDSLLKRGPDDKLTLSDEAKAMLSDLADLERTRVWADQRKAEHDRRRFSLNTIIEGTKAGYESRQNMYDARFEKDDEKRADAYERWQAAGARLEELTQRSNAWRAEAAKRAGEVAASAASSKALFASTKLFDFQRDGSLKIDATALANMGTTEAATAELARLIGVLTERNGLGQLRETVIGTLNGQNRRIADLIGQRG